MFDSLAWYAKAVCEHKPMFPVRLKAYVSYSETWENPNVATHALGNCRDGGGWLLHALQFSASVLDRRASCRICRCEYGVRVLLGAKKSMGSHECGVVGGNWYVGRCNGCLLYTSPSPRDS